MKKTTILLLIFLAINCKAQVKVPEDLGEGAVNIGLFVFSYTDTAKMDTAKHEFLQYNYHISHDKIFKQGNTGNTLTDSAKTTHDLGNDVKVATSLSITMINPTYLIDWKTKQVYTFYTKDRKLAISLDSLKTYGLETFYRLISLPDSINKFVNAGKLLFDTVGQKKVTVAGMPCYRARYKSSFNKSWRQFTYTTGSLPFFAPLNFFFGYEFPYPIVSIDCESNSGSYQDHQKHITICRYQIMAIDEKKQSPGLFRLPVNVPVRKNVSKAEMYN